MSAIFPSFLRELARFERSQARRVTSEVIASGETVRLLSGITWVQLPRTATYDDLYATLATAGVDLSGPPPADEPPPEPSPEGGPPEPPPEGAPHAAWCELLDALAQYAPDMHDLVPGLRYVRIDVVGDVINIEVALCADVLVQAIDLDSDVSLAMVPVDLALAYLTAHGATEVAGA
ncbi:hypothetical protein JT358_15220 [Micrococcales bacterium 31B]|nr:hypothetical protein [Micrococcales bacterium 31B]